MIHFLHNLKLPKEYTAPTNAAVIDVRRTGGGTVQRLAGRLAIRHCPHQAGAARLKGQPHLQPGSTVSTTVSTTVGTA